MFYPKTLDKFIYMNQIFFLRSFIFPEFVNKVNNFQ